MKHRIEGIKITFETYGNPDGKVRREVLVTARQMHASVVPLLERVAEKEAAEYFKYVQETCALTDEGTDSGQST